MKVEEFLWFAGILSFVSMSEAVVSRTCFGPNNVPTLAENYWNLTPVEIAERAAADLKNKCLVTALLENEDWRELGRTIKKSLEGFTYTMESSNIRMKIGDVTEVKILNAPSVIHSIDGKPGVNSDSVDLSLEIPRIEATAKASHCFKHPEILTPCVVVALIKNLRIDLGSTWSHYSRPVASSASIKISKIGSIKFTASTDDIILAETYVAESSAIWEAYLRAVQTGLQKMSNSQDLLRDFVKEIFT